jgi:ribonuclease H / adenosylcobalamin/alpha-ribazole phosphatase
VRRRRKTGRATSDAERRRLAQSKRERPARGRSNRPVLWCDGGARGNPGPAAYAFVITAPSGEVLDEGSGSLGVATATVAELRALIAGLARARELELARLEVRMDSQLAVAQLNGERAVKNAVIRRLLDDAHELAVGPVRFRWIPRHENGRANRLVARELGLDEAEPR